MNKILTVACWLLIAACSSKPDPADTGRAAKPEVGAMKLAMPQQDAPPAVEELPTEVPPQPIAARKIIRNAQLRIRVSDFAVSGRAIQQAVRQVGGRVDNANETRSSSTIENAMTIRVPANRLDAFLSLVLSQSIYQDTKTITAEDVTRRYVDVDARIRSKKAVEETYLRLLKQAKSIGDVLKVQEQLARIQEEREVQEAELRQLKDDVALSTVNLTYYQQTEMALSPEEPFYKQIYHNLVDGSRAVGSVLVGLFYFLPLGMIVAVVVWFIMRRRRNNPPKR